MPRLLRLVALLSAVVLLVTACGGGDDNSSSSTQSAPAASGSSSSAAPVDAAAVLAAAKVPTTGPVHSSLSLKALFSGTPKDQTLGAFLSGPIELTVDGTADAAT